jgi:redox-sensitive bicupin YhaK (pirin superfamily)
VNLPARLKMSPPRYLEIPAAAIPAVRRADGTTIRVVAGQADGARGPVTEIAADPTYLDVAVPAGADFVHPVPRGHAAFAYLFEGAAAFGPPGDESPRRAHPRLAVFEDGDAVRASAGPDGARFLLVSGLPLGEPVARYGPFVMNTREEILRALEDLRNGTFVRRG